jgi:hypothetical protein
MPTRLVNGRELHLCAGVVVAWLEAKGEFAAAVTLVDAFSRIAPPSPKDREEVETLRAKLVAKAEAVRVS